MGNLNRQSPRLSGYDYSQDGGYFVTICTQNRACLFGEVLDGQMRVNGFGQVVEEEWLQTAVLRPMVQLDAFVVMPNHIHGIIFIEGDVVGTRRAVSLQRAYRPEGFSRPISGSLSTIIRSFKSAVTKRINLMHGTPGALIWQGRFHDHIVRHDKALNAIREYILFNPERWDLDDENPMKKRP